MGKQEEVIHSSKVRGMCTSQENRRAKPCGSLTFSLKVFSLSFFNSFYKRLRFSFTVNVECEITFSQRLDLFQIREIEHESPTTVTITVSVSVPVTVAVDVNCQCD